MEKIKTLMWFLSKPSLMPQLIYQTYQSLFPHPKEDTRFVSERWCIENGITSESAIESITDISEIRSIKDIHKEDIERAERIVDGIPLKMGGGGDIDLLYYLCLYAKPAIVFETGVAYGWSSLSILLALNENKSGRLISTDMPYAKMNNENFVGCIVPDNLKSNWKLVRKPDRQAIKRELNQLNGLDLIHYDSDKSYRGRMWAYPILWNKLNKNGILISDDVNDNVAFKEFSELVDSKPTIVNYQSKSIGILVK